MTINKKSERNYRGKCLGWPVTSYGGEIFFGGRSYSNLFRVFYGCLEKSKTSLLFYTLSIIIIIPYLNLTRSVWPNG